MSPWIPLSVAVEVALTTLADKIKEHRRINDHLKKINDGSYADMCRMLGIRENNGDAI